MRKMDRDAQPLKASATPQLKTTEKLQIHVTNVDVLQIGQDNTLLYVTSSDTDDRQDGGDSEVKIVNEHDVQLNSYTISGTTILSIGDNCSLVEIKLNKEIERKLKDTGEFSVTKGDKLVSVLWRNDPWNNDSLTMTELKINFLKDGQEFNTKELEHEIFDNIREENNAKLRQLIRELIAMFKAKLKHIEIGCLQMVVSSETKHLGHLLEKQQADFKDLLRRTIIPGSVDMDIGFRTKREDKFKSVFDIHAKQGPSLKYSQKGKGRQEVARALRNIGDVTPPPETWVQTIGRYTGVNWLVNRINENIVPVAAGRRRSAQNE